MGNTINVQGNYIDIHDNEVVNLNIDKATVAVDNDNLNENDTSINSAQVNDNEDENAEPEVEALNYGAPKINLQHLLRQPWFADVRSNERYDAAWTDAFVEALMGSEYGEGIARDWAMQGKREKKNQIKGWVVGLLSDAGVLKGTYNSIAAQIKLPIASRTFSRYMRDGKRQPYAGWVKGYVAEETM